MNYDPEPWKADGACVDHPNPELWFPTKGSPGQRMKEARRICAGCPVRQECLDYALRNHEHFGMWGGLTERERRRHRRMIAEGLTGRIA